MRYYLGVLMCLLLSGCFAKNIDSAPTQYINIHKIKNAIPKNEQILKKHNPTSYVIHGKRYFVRKSPKGYNEIGYASWYGTKFHGRLTATGEPYDMLAMTAANKTLPIPCYAQVTNLENKRQVIVKINDRGPFVAGRIIDLSYAAALKLGIVGKGTAKVRVKTIDPNDDQYKHIQVTTLRKNDVKYIQVAVLKNREDAQNLQDLILEKANFLSIISPSKQGSKSFKVLVGPFENYTSAAYAKQYILKHHIVKDAIIT